MSIILLEHPRPESPERFEDVVNAPLSSCLMTGYVASVLKSKSLDLEVIDANLYGWSFFKTVQELKRKSFKLLGVHLVYLWENTEDVFEMLLDICKGSVGVHINLYGHFPTFAYKEILENYPFIDSIALGEPEITFLELAETVINCKDNSILYSIDGIDGLAFNSFNSKNPRSPILAKRELVKICSGGFSLDKHVAVNSELEGATLKPAVIKNKPRKPISNLDALPFPYRYNYELSKVRGIATYILASRGCYGECTFCYLDSFYGEESYWRGRSPENIFDEISQLYNSFEERYFYFADANFFGPGRKGKERVCELADLIIDKGLKIKFGMECRVNDVEDESISKLVKAGLSDVFLGIESGSQDSLNRFKKNTRVEESKRAINILRHHGIEPNYGFIMFEPNSTLEDIRENFEFLKEMKMLTIPSITAHLLHHKQTMFKGMVDYEKIKHIAKSVSKFNYEYRYEFKDKSVGDLCKNVNSFCYKALKDLSRDRVLSEEERNLCSYDECDLLSRKINEKLIDHFEKTLSSFENKGDRLLFTDKGAKDVERFI